MQCVILCAGKGTRMGEITKDTPKPLVKVLGDSLLEHKLKILPNSITEIIIVIGYMGEKIKEEIGESFNKIPIKYIEDKLLTGTAHALWQTEELLNDRFIVMMGDDIYHAKSIEELLKGEELSILGKIAHTKEPGSRIVKNQDGYLESFSSLEEYSKTMDDGGLIFTGLYSLTKDIFKYEPVKLETKDEWGLPQTLLKLAEDKNVQIIETNFWLPVGTPEELAEAENKLKSLHQ